MEQRNTYGSLCANNEPLAEERDREPKNKNQENDSNNWMHGAKTGEIVDTPLNPLLFSRG